MKFLHRVDYSVGEYYMTVPLTMSPRLIIICGYKQTEMHCYLHTGITQSVLYLSWAESGKKFYEQLQH